MQGYVYLIENQVGLVKIGWSTNPVARLSKINSDTSSHCRLLGFASGTRLSEKEAHRLCANERVHGEWYKKGEVVRLLIDRVPIFDRDNSLAIPKEGECALAAFRRRNRMSQDDLAQVLNVDRVSILRWEKSYVPIPVKRLFEIEAKTGIPRDELRPDIFQAKAKRKVGQ